MDTASVQVERKHELARCETCTLADARFVPSHGPQDAEIAVVGEAPGFQEAQIGKPFVGPSGVLLDAVLASEGIERSAVFVTNAVCCRPPENRTPTKQEIDCCQPRLLSELEGKPTVIALGNVAAHSVMGHKVKITKFRAGPAKESNLLPGSRIIPSIHPAACLRDSSSFPSLVTDIGKVNHDYETGRRQPPQYRVFSEADEAVQALQQLLARKCNLVVDIECAFEKDISFSRPDRSELLCVGLGYASGRAIVIGAAALQDPRVRNLLAQNLQQRPCVAHNGKFDLSALRQIAPNTELEFDTMLASYCMDERQGTHGLKYLAKEILGIHDYESELAGYKSFKDIPPDILHKYNAYDVTCTYDLWDHYRRELAKHGELWRLNEFLVNASNQLLRIEQEGIRVDVPLLNKIRDQYESELASHEEALTEWVDNPRSPKQVKEALAEKFSLRPNSVDVNALTRLASHAEAKTFVNRLLAYRQTHKLYSTYVKGIEGRLYDDRVHPTMLLHGTTSGRLSCRNPNLFNIPRESRIRELFIPGDNNVFVQVDFSQVELRVVACLAGDSYLREVFSDPTRDIHNEVAQRLGITRQRAKTIVYGLSYGMEARHLSSIIGVPVSTAVKYLEEFFSVIPGVRAWKQELERKLLHEQEDLVTPFGRHRRFWLITNENRRDVVKEGTAFLPQSIASDICLTALTRVLKMGLSVRVSVYDSIMVECQPSEVDEVTRILEQTTFQSGLEFSDFVPFVTDAKVGESWGALT